MDTCLPTQDPLRLAWSVQVWFIGPRGLSSSSLCLRLWHTLSYIPRILILKDHRGKERNGSCHFSSFNWDSAVLSVTEPPRGRHQTKEKTFHILLSFTTEGSYLFSHSVYLLFFIDFSHILSIYPSLCLYSPPLRVFYKVWHFDNTHLSTNTKKYTEDKDANKSSETKATEQETF